MFEKKRYNFEAYFFNIGVFTISFLNQSGIRELYVPEALMARSMWPYCSLIG